MRGAIELLTEVMTDWPSQRLEMEIHADGVVTVYDHRADWVAKTYAGPDALYAATGFMVKEEY